MTQKRPSEPFAPGNIVRLRQPYKLMDRNELRAFDGPMSVFTREAWKEWPGFTHGIVAEVIERGMPVRHEGGSLAGEVRRVSCYLYDPKRSLIYIPAEGYTVPTFVDFHVDELIPHKIAADEGYATLPEIVDVDGSLDHGGKHG